MENRKTGEEEDELFWDAVKLVIADKPLPCCKEVSHGYTRAARLVDMMEEHFVGPHEGNRGVF